MASSFSFDVVSEVDMQEVDNAVNQTKKELEHRYDFRGSNITVDLSKTEKTISMRAEGEHFIVAAVEVLHQKCIKRGISIMSLDEGKPEHTGGKTVHMKIKIKSGLEKEQAKQITALVKEQKMKVQAQIDGEHVRITGKSKDDLQTAIAQIKAANFDFPVQFTNYR